VAKRRDDPGDPPRPHAPGPAFDPAGSDPLLKVLGLHDAVSACEAARAAGRTVAQCHGCFDLVHPGHVRHLKQAARQADLLLVSITPDAHVGKGEGRPLFPAHLRAENLAALSFVDFVCVNTASTAERLLDLIRPDVYVKGHEYETNDDPRFASERRAVERHGGRVVFTSGAPVFSSTALIREIAHSRGLWHADDPPSGPLARLRSMHDLTLGTLTPIVHGMRGRRVVVVGEVVIDTYISCDHPGVASDSPCLSLRPLEQASFDGGSAVIALHAASLGAQVTLVTALPEDDRASAFTARMREAGVEVRTIACEPPMLEKERFVVGREKVFKIDRVHPLTLGADAHERLIGLVAESASGGVDAAIVADYGNGLLSPRTLATMTRTLRGSAGVLAGDVSGRRSSLTSLLQMDLVTPTEAELRDALQDYDSSLNAAVWALMQRTGGKRVHVTLADEGLIAFSRLPEAPGEGWVARVTGEHVPSLEREHVDTLGCGDALLSASARARASGASDLQAAYIGSLAAAVEARTPGNQAVTPIDLLARAARHDLGPAAAPPIVTVSQTERSPSGV